MTKLSFQYRPSEDRGGADHGWLKSFHTFSFADYYDPKFQNFGALRVINEDRVAPTTGFPTHPHKEAEIFSYILSGELSHKDSMGNVETMKRGDVQMTSGGTGIRHSEYNDHADKEVHFLQIWALPNQRGLKPKYFDRHFTDEEKKDKLVEIVAPVGQAGVVEERGALGPTPIHSNLHMWATLLSPTNFLTHTFQAPTQPAASSKLLYIQMVQSSGFNTESAKKDGSTALIRVSAEGGNATLGEGDGMFIRGGVKGDVVKLENTGDKVGELVLFEMDA